MSGEMGDDPVAGNTLLCGESRDFIGFLENEELLFPERSSAEEDAFFVLGEEWEHVEELIGKDHTYELTFRVSLPHDVSVDHLLRSIPCGAIRREHSKCMKNMELLILTTLEWRMASVTPYTYLRYFVHKFFGESCDTEKELLFAAMDLVLTISKEISTLDFRPSVVAAAVVLALTGDELTRNKMESKTSSISTGEHVYKCYRLIQDIKGRRNSKTPGNNTSFSSFSEDPSCCNPGNGSRKRLLFSESHQAPSNKIHKGNNTHASTNTK